MHFYRDTIPLSYGLIILLLMDVLIKVGASLFILPVGDLLGLTFMDLFRDNLILVMFLKFLQRIYFIVVVIMACFWIYRVTANAWILSPQKMSYSPGLSLGWFFIPVMNVWLPYVVMKEVYRNSFEEREKDKMYNPGFLTIWWIFWVIALLSIWLKLFTEDRFYNAAEGSYNISAILVFLAMTLFSILLNISFTVMIREITYRQTLAAERVLGLKFPQIKKLEI